MIFRVLVLLVSIYGHPIALAADCPKQDYSNPEKAPDYNCPGPGEDVVVPDIPSLEKSVPLRPGNKVPYEGILMDPNRVAKMGLHIKGLRRLRYNDMLEAMDRTEAEVEVTRASMAATLGLRTSQRDNYKEQVKDLQQELRSSNAWYRSWAFGLVLGIVITSASATALAVGLN